VAGLAAGGVPVLLLAATEPPPPPEDRRAALDAFRATVSHTQVRVLEGRPHHLLEAQPEETARLAADWLRSL
jgi:pimeloyl-ACP methyl ester carboxylesterase